MVRKIFGSVIDLANQRKPIQGLRIQAWDYDLTDADDFLGEAITDKDGNYEIQYSAQQWDLALEGITAGRPDIYVSADIKNRSDQWVWLDKSRVYKDHDLQKNLKINLSLRIEGPIKKLIPFNPKKQGFNFANSFKLEANLFGFEFESWGMGFCGGMCAAVLNRLEQNIPMGRAERLSKTPASGKDLFNELLFRQIISMSPAVLTRMFDWQGAPDEDSWKRKSSIGLRTKREWRRLKSELDNDKPTILVLIRVVGTLANPTDNHQVLAIGYEYSPSTKDLRIYEYDPNRNNKVSYLSMNLGLPRNRLDLTDSSENPTRGFFVNPFGSLASR